MTSPISLSLSLKLVFNDLRTDFNSIKDNIWYEEIVLVIDLLNVILFACESNFDFQPSNLWLIFSIKYLKLSFLARLKEVGSTRYFILDEDDLYGNIWVIVALTMELILLVKKIEGLLRLIIFNLTNLDISPDFWILLEHFFHLFYWRWLDCPQILGERLGDYFYLAEYLQVFLGPLIWLLV